MKYDNYFYINNEINFHLDTSSSIEHFNTEVFKGPKGEQGNLGYTGARGLQGLQGERGVVGNQGIQGDQGPQGYRGISGVRGDQGAPGANGEKGDIGLQGYIGPRGDCGIRGPPGPKGVDGPKGMTGLDGFRGIIGQPGEKGKPGEKKPPFLTDDSEQSLPTTGAMLSMDGFSDVTSRIEGKIQNPYVPFTIDYGYNFNGAKSVICPPYTYLKGFSFMRKGPQPGTWGSSNGSTLKTGFKAKGKKVGDHFNDTRHGMPHSYKAMCHRLNGSGTIISNFANGYRK